MQRYWNAFWDCRCLGGNITWQGESLQEEVIIERCLRCDSDLIDDCEDYLALKVYLTSNQQSNGNQSAGGDGMSIVELGGGNSINDSSSPMSLHLGGGMSPGFPAGSPASMGSQMPYASNLNVLSIAMEGAMKAILMADEFGRSWLSASGLMFVDAQSLKLYDA